MGPSLGPSLGPGLRSVLKIALIADPALMTDPAPMICGTKSPDYLLCKDEINQRAIDQKLVMDLSVPRNADPELSRNPRITLLNIDQINRLLKIRRRRMTHLLAEAEARVSDAAHAHVARYTAKSQSNCHSFSEIA